MTQPVYILILRIAVFFLFLVAGVLASFGIRPAIFPRFTSLVLIELHKNKTGQHWLRLFYKNDTDNDKLWEVEINDCSYPCTLTNLRKTRRFLMDNGADIGRFDAKKHLFDVNPHGEMIFREKTYIIVILVLLSLHALTILYIITLNRRKFAARRRQNHVILSYHAHEIEENDDQQMKHLILADEEEIEGNSNSEFAQV